MVRVYIRKAKACKFCVAYMRTDFCLKYKIKVSEYDVCSKFKRVEDAMKEA